MIPEGITSIGDYAFVHCLDLTSVVIPEGVTEIGDGLFLSCSSLVHIRFDGTRQMWNSIAVSQIGNEYLEEVAIHCEDDPADACEYCKNPAAPEPTEPTPTAAPAETAPMEPGDPTDPGNGLAWIIVGVGLMAAVAAVIIRKKK